MTAGGAPSAALLIAGRDGRIRHAETGPGQDGPAWVGQTLAEALPRPLHTPLEPAFQAALTGASRSFEAADGDRLHHVQLAPMHGDGGEVVSVAIAIQQPPGPRAAEAEQLTAEHLFRQGFDAAPVGMLLSDPAEGRCLRVNDTMCRLLHRTREELLDGTVELVAHPEDAARIRRARAELLSGATDTFKAEIRYRRADGNLLWGLLHITPVRRQDGSVQAFHSQVIDITERKEREERLEHDIGDALWLQRLREALDHQRLVLFSQPIIDLVTGETVQHELLLRMVGEDGTIIAPAAFLPAAERYGLIGEIDRWVIREAARSAGGGTPTEFNLSGRSVEDPATICELAGAIAETGADPSLLVVEVTETALVGHLAAGRRFAQRVRDLGCRLALDDFGTGFSSLSYLKHFPADHLKIDIEFVRELARSETDARVVRGIVGLAREFNQTTVAEGVEDEATLLPLKEMGVDRAQGYLFGAPAPRAPTPSSPPPISRPAAGGGSDPVAVVREAFDAFAMRDVPRMLSHCRADIVLRPVVTSRVTERTAPYRGHEGIRAYLADVAAVWDELTVTPFATRQAQGSVIGFGRVDGRRPGGRILASLLWIVRLERDQIASMEVFHAAGEDALGPEQLRRLDAAGSAAGF
jgi:PAS domain S-box-containing protein